MCSFIRTAVSSSWEFIMKPPSPQSATHWRDGSITLAANVGSDVGMWGRNWECGVVGMWGRNWECGIALTLAAIAAGRPAPIVASALSSSTVLGSRAGYARATWILYMPLSRQRIADGCSAREVVAEVRWRRRRRRW